MCFLVVLCINPQPFDQLAGQDDFGTNPSFHGIRLNAWFESVQRESNPHFRHGKAVGYRYIMDAFDLVSDCQRSVVVSMRSEGLEPSPVRLRAGNAAANTSISL